MPKQISFPSLILEGKFRDLPRTLCKRKHLLFTALSSTFEPYVLGRKLVLMTLHDCYVRVTDPNPNHIYLFLSINDPLHVPRCLVHQLRRRSVARKWIFSSSSPFLTYFYSWLLRVWTFFSPCCISFSQNKGKKIVCSHLDVFSFREWLVGAV